MMQVFSLLWDSEQGIRLGAVRHSVSAPLIIFLWALTLTGCNSAAPPKATKAPRVEATTPIIDLVMDYQDFTGRLEAVKSVEIRSRVTGYITEIPFKEGDLVREGDLLFQIDRRPYAADLNLAEANVKVSVTERSRTEKNAERANQLRATKAIAPEQYDAALAERDKAVAAVEAAEAARERAKLFLDYTRVTAPITGRISRRYVDSGNLINADNTVLTTIVAEDPIYAYFDVDERTYLDLPNLGLLGKGTEADGQRLPVMMRLANESEFTKVGAVDFVDNRVTATTGTVRMRGVFANAMGALKPGLFVRIRLPIGAAYSATLIPDEAIQSDQERKYIWVVNSKGEAEYRSVKLGQSIKDLRVIRPPEKGKKGKEGVAQGERVIISGMQRVRNAMKVEAEMKPPPAPPQMPLVRLLAHNPK
jgi:multidrug efflux system membrane fusion protein